MQLGDIVPDFTLNDQNNEDKGISKRANVLVSKNKEIVFMKIYEMSTVPNLDEINEFIKKNVKKEENSNKGELNDK